MSFGFDVESFWTNRPKQKDTKRFLDPEDMLREAFQYFQWMDTHPLQEATQYHYKGSIVNGSVDKMRPYTLKGLAVFLGCSTKSIIETGKDPRFADAVEYLMDVIYTQKFEGAAAGLLAANIITRDLGLAEKSELTGANGGPIETKDMSARDLLAQRLAALTPDEAEDSAAGESE